MHYSIADLEKFTGIKAHTIRIWEQRYSIVSPHRTETNIRYYDDDQLRKLLNVAALVRGGHRISKISKMTQKEMDTALDDLGSREAEGMYAKEVNALITSALTYNEEMFHRTFADCMLRYGLEDTYVHVLHPVLMKTGLMWSTNDMDVCQEHFVSNLIRQKLFTAADRLANPKPGAKTWVLFLPESEQHDIGLLYANFLIRYYGHKVIYLGQRVPLDTLEENITRIDPDYVLTFLKHTYQIDWAQRLVNAIDRKIGDYNPLCSGQRDFMEQLEQPSKVKFVTSPDVLMQYLVGEKQLHR